MKLTEEIIDTLNSELRESGAGFYYEFKDEFTPTAQVKLIAGNNNWIDSSIINFTREYCDWLRNFFRRYNIEIEFNNTLSIIWSNDFSS